jgi:eukaryotic-like serine/threonine-protein kinase
VAIPFELGSSSIGYLYPAYLRGEAYLRAGQGQQAAAEYNKVLGHPGIMLNFVTGALTHLQLARSQAMNGDYGGARKSYQDFLVVWKEADAGIPILEAAKAEYQHLH